MIGIQGIVGCGKSTIASELSARERIPVFLEPVETNPYLMRYYSEPTLYAFPMQVFLLHNRFKHSLKAQMLKQCVMDTTMYTNDIFVELQYQYKYMSEDDYENYCSVSNTFKNLIRTPDLMVYLQCSPQVAINRIIQRGRPSELRATIQYWYDLYHLNERWYDEYSDGKKILINVDYLDVVKNESDLDYVLDNITEALLM